MEFVAHEASEWGMEVEEWLDKFQMHLSHQHSKNNYAFINVDDNSKMASPPCMLPFLVHDFRRAQLEMLIVVILGVFNWG
jgi:hypothetical protein